MVGIVVFCVGRIWVIMRSLRFVCVNSFSRRAVCLCNRFVEWRRISDVYDVRLWLYAYGALILDCQSVCKFNVLTW